MSHAIAALYLKHTVVHFSDLVPEEVLHLLPFHLERDVGDKHTALDGGLRTATSPTATASATPTVTTGRT